MINLYRVHSKTRLASGRSYREIAAWLTEHGETGQYCAVPKPCRNPMKVRSVEVTVHKGQDIYDTYGELIESGRDVEILIDGARY